MPWRRRGRRVVSSASSEGARMQWSLSVGMVVRNLGRSLMMTSFVRDCIVLRRWWSISGTWMAWWMMRMMVSPDVGLSYATAAVTTWSLRLVVDGSYPETSTILPDRETIMALDPTHVVSACESSSSVVSSTELELAIAMVRIALTRCS